MKVDKELIEKYHLGVCSEEERAAVEAWLWNEEGEAEILLPKGEKPEVHKEEMWQAIASAIPSLNSVSDNELVGGETLHKGRSFHINYWAVAASLVIGIIAIVGWDKYKCSLKAENPPLSMAREVRVIDTKELSIVLASQSKAQVKSSDKSGNINFCGPIMINPKKDFELTLHGTCATSYTKLHVEKVNLKKGNTYIAVNYRFNTESELIIVNERNLLNLPPLLQREIKNIFRFNL